MRRSLDTVGPSLHVDWCADEGNRVGHQHAAVLLQAGYPKLLEDLVMCVVYVVAASSWEEYAIDI